MIYELVEANMSISRNPNIHLGPKSPSKSTRKEVIINTSLKAVKHTKWCLKLLYMIPVFCLLQRFLFNALLCTYKVGFDSSVYTLRLLSCVLLSARRFLFCIFFFLFVHVFLLLSVCCVCFLS